MSFTAMNEQDRLSLSGDVFQYFDEAAAPVHPSQQKYTRISDIRTIPLARISRYRIKNTAVIGRISARELALATQIRVIRKLSSLPGVSQLLVEHLRIGNAPV